jgi:hypothetical protein
MDTKASGQYQPTPEVIVDFIFEDGLFFVAVINIGPKPALQVHIVFDQKIMGEGGTKEITALALFENIEFLAPGRKITVFVDSSAAYFARKEPTTINVQISYKDADGMKYEANIRHDLRIYQDIPFIPRNM